MILCDVNVWVYAFRRDIERHEEYRDWLRGVMDAPGAYGVSDQVASSFLRIVTNPRILERPSTTKTALEFVTALRDRPNAVSVVPGSLHWSIFRELCERPGVRGDVVPDAWLAALAIEAGCEWITTDRGFERFPELSWRHPLE